MIFKARKFLLIGIVWFLFSACGHKAPPKPPEESAETSVTHSPVLMAKKIDPDQREP